MSDMDVEVAVMKQKISDLTRRIEKLEGNQRWGVLGILSLGVKAVFDFVMNGGAK